MSKHLSSEEPEPPEIPDWQYGLIFTFVIFFAVLGIWRIVVEFIV